MANNLNKNKMNLQAKESFKMAEKFNKEDKEKSKKYMENYRDKTEQAARLDF